MPDKTPDPKVVVELVDHIPAWAVIAALLIGAAVGFAFVYVFVDFAEETPNA